MDTYVEQIRKAKGSELEIQARAIAEDKRLTEQVVSELVHTGNVVDSELIAIILGKVPLDYAGKDSYYSVVGKSTFGKPYVELFLTICSNAKIPESDFIRTLINTSYTQNGSFLFRWKRTADEYIKRRAIEDYGVIAEYIDAYDKKFYKYDILILVDENKAIPDLIDKLLYQKNIDKASVRRVLMNKPEIGLRLIKEYPKFSVKEKIAIVRLLALYRNDTTVNKFLADVAANEPSKMIRNAINGVKRRYKIKDVPKFFEELMVNGEGLACSAWNEILTDEEVAAVADRLFFCVKRQDGVIPVLFNDGVFLNIKDMPMQFDGDETVYVLHIIDLPRNSEILGLNIEQPIKQLGRKLCFAHDNTNYRLSDLNGSIISEEWFNSNIKRLGFAICESRSDSSVTLVKFVSDYAVCVDVTEKSKTVSCEAIYYCSKNAISKINRKYYCENAVPVLSTTLPRREFSELTLAVYELFLRDYR